jgi:hypothetical protein
MSLFDAASLRGDSTKRFSCSRQWASRWSFLARLELLRSRAWLPPAFAIVAGVTVACGGSDKAHSPAVGPDAPAVSVVRPVATLLDPPESPPLSTVADEPVGVADEEAVSSSEISEPPPIPMPVPVPVAAPPIQPVRSPQSAPSAVLIPRGPWSVSMTTSSVSLPGGKGLKLEAVVANTTATRGAVNIEVYGPLGNRVHQFAFDDVFMAAGSHKFQAVWARPVNSPPGMYRVSVGIFSRDWGRVLHWQDEAALVQLSSP